MPILPALATAIAMLVSGHRQGARALAVVHADAAGDPGADHRLADLEPAAGDHHLVRRADRAVALLRLHGLRETALEGGVGSALASDPGPADRWTLDDRPGRFRQRQDRAQGVRLSDHLRPCRQDQPKPVPVGADDCHGGSAQEDPRTLELPAVGVRLLFPSPDVGVPDVSACGARPSSFRPSLPKRFA